MLGHCSLLGTGKMGSRCPMPAPERMWSGDAVSDCPGTPLPSVLGVWVCFWRGKVVSDARAGSASTARAVWAVRQKITSLGFKYHDFLLFLFFPLADAHMSVGKKKKKSLKDFCRLCAILYLNNNLGCLRVQTKLGYAILAHVFPPSDARWCGLPTALLGLWTRRIAHFYLL